MKIKKSNRWRLPARALQLILAVVLLGAVLGGCPMVSDAGEGSLVIQFPSERGLDPGIVWDTDLDMEMSSYTISGSGPLEESFSVEEFTGTSFTRDGLAVGDWEIVIDGYNTAGDKVGTATIETTIRKSQTSTEEADLSPLTGEGDLYISVEWTDSESKMVNPQVLVTLRDESGADITDISEPVELTLDGQSASKTISDLPTGWYEVTVELKEGVPATLARVVQPSLTYEVVWEGKYTARIVKDQTTEGSVTVSENLIDFIIRTYTLSFDANGGTGTMDDVDLDTNEQTTLPANEFTRDGYTFAGWATSAEGTVEYEDEADYTMGTEDATLYAVWSANTNTAYTVEHYQQDTSGSGYAIVTADTESLSGTTGATATATAKTYTGFSENEEYGDRVASGTIAGDGSLVLKLYYDRDTFTVSYEENGGSSVSDTTDVRYGAMISAPTDPTKAGYSFEGWYTDVELTDAWDFTADTVTEDATLYAAWESVDPKVGDLGPAGGYIFYDDTVGYDFDGNSTIESTEKDLLDGTNDGTVNGDRYLEAAPYGWYNNGDDPYLPWNDGTATLLGTATAVGTGEDNTDTIVSAVGEARAITPTTYAAPACDDYSVTVDGTNYDDWFLPSKDELNLMYQNLYLQSMGDFGNTTINSETYWSSSEKFGATSYRQAFNTGYQDHNSKNLTYLVRPVRAF